MARRYASSAPSQSHSNHHRTAPNDAHGSASPSSISMAFIAAALAFGIVSRGGSGMFVPSVMKQSAMPAYALANEGSDSMASRKNTTPLRSPSLVRLFQW